jgi:phosphatidylethanolamine/phosphatidyl-N-methylethanolamine N-methyltransferase
MNDTLRFLRAFVERPFATGAIAPSSQRLAAQMVDKLCLRDAETVVEIGPGTGALTRAILDDIAPHTLLLAVELNPRFAAHLRETLPARVDVVNGSGEHLAEYLRERGRREADCIVSGLPWASFTRELQERLLSSVVGALRPGGRFTTFAYVHGLLFPSARRLGRMLGARFASVERSKIVWRNLPPAFVYRCSKGGTG